MYQLPQGVFDSKSLTILTLGGCKLHLTSHSHSHVLYNAFYSSFPTPTKKQRRTELPCEQSFLQSKSKEEQSFPVNRASCNPNMAGRIFISQLKTPATRCANSTSLYHSLSGGNGGGSGGE